METFPNDLKQVVTPAGVPTDTDAWVGGWTTLESAAWREKALERNHCSGSGLRKLQGLGRHGEAESVRLPTSFDETSAFQSSKMLMNCRR